MYTTEAFAEALRAILRERGFTEKALGDLAGYKQNTISRYASGVRGRELNAEAIKTISDIAVALKLDPSRCDKSP